MLKPATAKTVGWSPSCACDAEIISCTVLDPFTGAGTTLMVAERLGRDSIGIELNPEYAELAHTRVRSDLGRVEGGSVDDKSDAGPLFTAGVIV